MIVILIACIDAPLAAPLTKDQELSMTAAAIGEMYDAKVRVLSEYVKHHVKEEQNEMFPKAKASSLDLVELGAHMAARKADLFFARISASY